MRQLFHIAFILRAPSAAPTRRTTTSCVPRGVWWTEHIPTVQDENAPAYSVAFSNDGARLFTGQSLLLFTALCSCSLPGFKNVVRVFDTSRPGRDAAERPTFCAHMHLA